MTRSGFVALAGRPNAGKSTLVNRIVGGKVAIVSDKPQTTRREIRGIATGPDWQLVLVDLPGVQRPRDPLTERMQRRVERALADSDAVLFVLNGEQQIGAGRPLHRRRDRAASGVPAVTALNKVDRLDRRRTVTALAARGRRSGVHGEIFPISARSGAGVGALVERAGVAAARGPVPLPARGPERPARAGAPGRAGARAGAAAHARGAAARGGGGGRRDRGARGRPARGARPGVGRDRVAEGDPGRRRRADGQGGRAPPRGARSRRCWAAACTSSCRCGCARAGAATRRCSTGWASSDARAHPRLPDARTEEAVVDEVRPLPHGTALLTPSLPLVWQLNAVRVEDPAAEPGGADGRRPRRCWARSATASWWCTTPSWARGSRARWPRWAGTSAACS